MSKKKSDKDAWADGLEDWGAYMAAKKAKLEDQFDELADKEFSNATDLFKGIAIFVNGYTNPSADELKRLMMSHGGTYHHYQRTGSTTHIIASNLPYSKIIQYRKHKNPLPLCKPEWIVDSINAKKLLDWRPYLLYNSTSVTQPELQFKNINNSTELGNSKENVINSSSSSNCDSTIVKASKSTGGPLCTKNEEFLTEFYNNSRLHHISTMGATFKEYVNELRAKNTGSFQGLERLKKLHSIKPSVPVAHDSDSDEDLFASPCNKSPSNVPIIMHIDMDCFFVSVGLRNNPKLKGLPIAVCHAKGNKSSSNINGDKDKDDFGSMAEIASCSYEARKAGIKNGMFLGQALKLCPNLKTIKYDFEGYKEVSYILYNTVASYTLDIEAVSCDELYADVSTILETCHLNPMEFATHIREEIIEKTSCPVSTGFGNSKLQARLATKKAKPNGQFFLKNQSIQDYIGTMDVRDIPGVGYTTMQQLKKMNIKVCSDLQKVSLGILQKEFGKKSGEMLYNTCRGIDTSKLNIEHVRKSVSTEVNYGIRFDTDADARDFLKKLSHEVFTRLTKINSRGRCITLKLMVRAKDAPVEPAKFMGHGHCDNFTKSKNFLTPVDDVTIITKEVLSLWNFLQQPADQIRGIGIQISKLETLKKQADTFMMKFIAKAQQNTVINDNVHRDSLNLQPKLSTHSHDNVSKKEQPKSNKPQGLKAFFTAKSSVAQPSKPSKIDEMVLGESPDDIESKTVKLHGNDSAGHSKNIKVNQLIGKNELNGANPSADEQQNSEHDFKLNNVNSAENIALASQSIDESVLIELPEDIRNEILATKPNLKNSTTNKAEKATKSTQELPENYFKHKKAGKFSKPKLPDIKQLDMAVLIELPDEIRNEILDHYKTNQNNETKSDKPEDFNVSFSQVDPDFLAALTDDMKEDVKHYCTTKKQENSLKLSEKFRNPVHLADSNTKQTNSIINKNKGGRKPKNTLQNNGKNINSMKNISVQSKSTVTTKEIVDKQNEPSRNDKSSLDKSFLENEINTLENNLNTNDRRAAIKIHLSNYEGIATQSAHHQMMLENLVNYLFSLPIQQVKNQIQAWIQHSEKVNEIDTLAITTFLSMLPQEELIEDLHVLMKTIQRCMTETGSCDWHETYRKIVNQVQHYMQIHYNSNLMLLPIKCKLCNYIDIHHL